MIFFYLLALGWALSFVMLIRNELVFTWRQRATDICHQNAQKRIPELEFHSWRKEWNPYENGPSYNAMLWQLNKWSFEAFYPGLVKK